MKKFATTSLFLVFTLFLSIASARAEEGYEVSIETRVSNRYVYQDLAADVSNKPGFETNLSISWGHWTFDWWERFDLADGTYGDRGDGDEHDFTFTGNWELGAYSLEASAAYWLLAPLDDGDTDGFLFYVDFGRTYELGERVSITPAVRAIEFIGVSDYPNYTQVRVRMPIEFQVPGCEGVTLGVDPSFTGSLTGGTEHDFVFRPTVWANWDINDNWWLGGEFKSTNHSKSEFDFIVGYAWL